MWLSLLFLIGHAGSPQFEKSPENVHRLLNSHVLHCKLNASTRTHTDQPVSLSLNISKSTDV